MIPYILQGNNIAFVIDNKPFTISSSHVAYEKIKAAIRASDWELVKKLADPVSVVVNYSKGKVRVDGNKVFWGNIELHGTLVNRIVSMLKEDFPVDPFVNFIDNLMQNPSKRAVDELYSFLEAGNLPITPDGHFLAYKKVTEDFKDIYTGKLDNSVGAVVEMERNQVDDNKDRTCSSGLHFCSKEYLKSAYCERGKKTVIVKINPRDVVSIPSDYNNTKGRTCRYEVVGELEGAPEAAFTTPVQKNANNVATSAPTFSKDYICGYNYAFESPQTVADSNLHLYKNHTSGKYWGGMVDGLNDRRANKRNPAVPVFVPLVRPSQEFTLAGAKLSMTKTAIRKRETRRRSK